MDARIRYAIKKSRRYWPVFAVAAIVCLIFFLVVNFSLNDRNGAFDKLPHSASTVSIPANRTEFNEINIEASNVSLEVGMVNNTAKPQVFLFGEDYHGQSAKVDIENGSCAIVLDENDATPETLTMRILLPQSDVAELNINGETLNLNLNQMRATRITANIDEGYAYVANVKTDGLVLNTGIASVRLADNQITKTDIQTKEGSVTFLENKIKLTNVSSDTGNIFVYEPKWNGQWNAKTISGDITTLSGNLPYNFLIDAQSAKNGSVSVDYSGRYWDEPDVADNTKTHYYGSVGNNPIKVLTCETKSGDISIGKRARYSNLDPYAEDYPYSTENPYLKIRATITK